jgi:dipeptidyl aminopeptidase/acylaminoacyl peptidase
MLEPITAPYGAWRSPVRIDDVVSDVVVLGEPWIDGDDVYWLEGRPTEAGRRVLVRAATDGSTMDLISAPFNVRTRAHEYGGGSYVVAGGVVVFSDFGDGRLYRLDPGAEEPVAITPAGPWRYADLRPDLARRRFYAVREDHSAEGEPASTIVAIPLDGGEATVLVSGQDFVAAPRLSPDEASLAWLEWDHPDMPWDATRVRVARFGLDGRLGEPSLAAGGPDEAVVQPEWAPDGTLHLISDRSGWWNLYRIVEGPRLEPLAPMEAEFADPAWIFDRSSYGFLADGAIAAVGRVGGRDRLFRIEPGVRVDEIETPFTELDALRVGADAVVVLAGAPTDPTTVARLDPITLAPAGILRRASTVVVDPAYLSRPESIEFPTSEGAAHALYYQPTNPGYVAPDGERPPLVVRAHGGPTSNALTALDLGTQILTSRGIAVVDVDYGGSTGYGRDYRRRLDGRWGIVDVDDCVAAARFLVERGDVDPDRLAIEGGSAGGYTTLAALTFRDVFAAGISLFGVGDLEVFVTVDPHKFESRYSDRLLGPYPEAANVYRERSPIHFADRISAPVLILQGLDDRVVLPQQAEIIVEALRANGVPHAYLAFEGEGHGFRGTVAIRRTVEARLSFLGQVFGYEPADELEPLELPGLADWRARHARTGALGSGARSGPC